jgi:hypothetical protein
MPWVEVIVVFVVSHAAGDFLLQTEWQATRKRHGAARKPEQRRALLSHGLSYLACFVPALIWIGGERGAAAAVGTALAVAVPHVVQDDGRLLLAYSRAVKKASPTPGDPLFVMIDQSFHLVALFALALLVGR